MRLRLREDAYLADTDSGAFILTSAGSVTITGSGAARWIRALAPRLDGRYSLEEIISGLPAAHAATAESLLAELRDAGVVREVRSRTAGAPTDAADREFAHEFSHLSTHGIEPDAVLRRFRGLSVLVLAEPRWSAEILANLRVAGSTHARAAESLPGASARPDAPGAPGAVDLILHVSQPATTVTVGELDGWCQQHGIACIHMLVDGPRVWLTPVGEPGRKPGPAAPARAGSLLARRWDSWQPGQIADIQLAVAAAQLVRAGFRWVAGLSDPRRSGKVARLNPDLTTSRHHCLPHPYQLPASAPDQSTLLARITALCEAPDQQPEEFASAATRAGDDCYGAFRFVSDDTTPQSPLHVAEAEVCDPLAAGPGEREPLTMVRAVAFDYPTARIEAARRALTCYASQLIDPRRLADRSGTPLATPDARPAELYAVVASGAPQGLVAGYDLSTGQVRQVPAVTVFPRLSRRGDTSGHVGLGYGASWREAVGRGLADHWRYEQFLLGCPPGREIRVDAATLNDTGRRCAEILTALGEMPMVYDHEGRHGVTVLSFRRGGETLVRTAGAAADAWTDGLLEALFTVQLRIHGGHARPGGSTTNQRPVTTFGSGPAPAIDVSAIAARLAGTGLTAVVVPLDHDPAVAGILPQMVRVVLTRG